MTTMVRLQVAVDTPQHAGLSGALDYLSEHPLSPGTLVRAPLGRRDLLGIVWSQGAVALAESELRPLTAVLC